MARSLSRVCQSFLLGLFAVFLAGGCKKHEASIAVATNDLPASSPASATSPGRPGPEAPAPVVVPDSGDVNATLHQLSLELRKYVVRTRSVPKNFEEFATKSHAQIPPAPVGKKYAIEGQAVVLVKS